MSRKANPTVIGAFIIGALLLILGGLFLFAGGSLLQERDRFVMFFEGSVYGLQVGAPVVFRGVRVGSVKSINLRFDERSRSFLIPVTVETDPEQAAENGQTRRALPDSSELVARGLRARLSTQSFLTGQLYVELDFHPDKAAVFRSTPPDNREIPTIPSPVQELASKLEQIDIASIANDLSTIASSTRELVQSPELKQSLININQALQNLQSISAKLDKAIDPAVGDLRTALADTSSAMAATEKAMARFEDASNKFGKLADPDSPLQASLIKTSEELGRTAASLQSLTHEESPSVVQFNRALKDMGTAAGALRDLADSIERHPESLLKGRKP
ncbi:MlaD family protein [Uliginosibacterium sp. H1]|uniref:MlaD family protein n=1 Tax=Uliginosibacterium sp. H1 TaxID=3114757 RepID=UPI002E1830C8|nr:MlaD family protein [Uliginosibacterium sp. H1]